MLDRVSVVRPLVHQPGAQQQTRTRLSVESSRQVQTPTWSLNPPGSALGSFPIHEETREGAGGDTNGSNDGRRRHLLKQPPERP